MFNLTVSNAGKAESRPVTVKAALPDAAEFVRADPPPTSNRDGELVWTLDPVAAGGKQTVALTVRPTRRGSLTVPASAETPDGVRAESRAMVSADTAGLKVAVELPAHAGVGDPLTARVAVTNPGAVPLENATAWVGFDKGLTHDAGANPAEVRVGTVPPGDTKRVEVPLTAKATGKSAVRVSVTADGGLTERAEATVDVRNAALKLSLSGPESVTLGQEDTWTLNVTNAGDVAVPEAVARVNLPEALAAKSASDGGTLGGGGAEWRLGSLAPGAKKVVRLTAAAGRLTDRAVVSANAARRGVGRAVAGAGRGVGGGRRQAGAGLATGRRAGAGVGRQADGGAGDGPQPRQRPGEEGRGVRDRDGVAAGAARHRGRPQAGPARRPEGDVRRAGRVAGRRDGGVRGGAGGGVGRRRAGAGRGAGRAPAATAPRGAGGPNTCRNRSARSRRRRW